MVTEPQFEVVEPRSAESPVVVEVPHAGLSIDPETLLNLVAPARSIARDADLYVDALWQDAPSEGATLLFARASRFVVDLNRSETDVDADTVEGGGKTPWPRGVVWRLTTDNEPMLANRLSRAELERRLTLVHRPYHAKLREILERKRALFGFAILLCGHSMPTEGRRGGADLAGIAGMRADLVPGTRGRTTAAGSLIDTVDAHGKRMGWSVVHDHPYRGGFSTGHYGMPDRNIHAIQLEVARRLYMEEATLRIRPDGFRTVREFARTLVARFAVTKADTLVGAAPNGGSARRS
ncbi:MAG TPA: N-formylglutamate amidohydrolase [Polyangiaceae bacterium]|nr:N-formylglutamate amidohydrolase [Polyangiaceae bacterium]